MHKLLYKLFGFITIVNKSGYRLTRMEKARVRSFAACPVVFVSIDDHKPGELRVMDYHGEYLYNTKRD